MEKTAKASNFNIVFLTIGVLSLLINLYILYDYITGPAFNDFFTTEWFVGPILFTIFLLMAKTFVSLGAPYLVDTTNCYYGILMIAVSMFIYCLFAYNFFLNSEAAEFVIDGRLNREKYFGYICIIAFFGIIGAIAFLGSYQNVIGNYPKLIPYTMAIIGLAAAAMWAYKYIVLDDIEHIRIVWAELGILALIAGTFAFTYYETDF